MFKHIFKYTRIKKKEKVIWGPTISAIIKALVNFGGKVIFFEAMHLEFSTESRLASSNLQICLSISGASIRGVYHNAWLQALICIYYTDHFIRRRSDYICCLLCVWGINSSTGWNTLLCMYILTVLSSQHYEQCYKHSYVYFCLILQELKTVNAT